MQLSPHPPVAESMENIAVAAPTSFEIIFAPMLQVVSTMRRFVLALYERVLADAHLSAQMALATHELLENAVKYNTDAGARLRISLVRQAGSGLGHAVVIRTRNRATPEHIRVAEQLIARVRDAEDPDLFYQQMIRGAAEKADGSGLGLARIRAETEMTIDVHIEGDEIEVVARTLLPVGGAR